MNRQIAALAILCTLSVAPVALAQAPMTELISKDSLGIQGDNSSFSAVVSGDGRFVAFHSLASNLTPEGNSGGFNVYLHERDTGLTELISITRTGEASVSSSTAGESINADGRFVAFYSRATNLTPGPDLNGSRTDIFVRDRRTGTTEFVSLNSAGAQSNGFSFNPTISADGRFVAFQSSATNLGPGFDSNRTRSDIFVRDRETGVTELVSINSDGLQGNDSSRNPVISADGRFVAFYSSATNLAPGGDANGRFNDIFLHDRYTGETELISVNSAGEQANGSSVEPSISADGTVVAFHSSATNLVPGGDVNGRFIDVFIRDRLSGLTELVSVNSMGEQGNDVSSFPSLNGDGRLVAFTSRSTNLVEGGDANGRFSDIFVHDRETGTTELINVNNAGTQSNGFSDLRDPDTLSDDGRIVAFQSTARNLIPEGDLNGEATDIFARDRGITNLPPIADAGNDRTVECQAPEGASVTLDGSGSFDPDGDQLTFAWTGAFPEDGGSATGIGPTVTLALGITNVTLVVNDGQVDSEPDTAAVRVQDTTPPALLASLTPVGAGDEAGDDDEGRFRIDFAAEDSCDPAPSRTAVLLVPGNADIPVEEGQIIEFEFEDEETEVESEDGILEIEAPSLTLLVTGSDASGNLATAEAKPTGLSSDNEVDPVASLDLDD